MTPHGAPPKPTQDDHLRAILEDYQHRAVKALRVPVGRIVRAPGIAPAWDDCCEGQLYTRVIRVTPRAGRRSAAGLSCDVIGWEVTAALGAVRCAATLDSQGNPPSAGDVTADGDAMTRDLNDLQKVVLCSPYTSSVIEWVPLEVQGGCHGGEWRFTFRVPTCGC